MASSYMLKPNIKFLNHPCFKQQYPPIRFSPMIKLPTKSFASINEISRYSYENIHDSLKSKQHRLKKLKKATGLELVEMATCRNNLYENVTKYLLKSLRDPLIAIVLLLLLALFYSPNASFAASGGRMGGSSSSCCSDSSCYSSSTSSDSSCYSSSTRSDSEPNPVSLAFGVVLLIVLPFMGFICMKNAEISILKLQVAFKGSARSLQNDLNWIAKSADTSQKEGLVYILMGTTKALLRHRDYWISGYSSVNVMTYLEDWRGHFRKLSLEERRKFDEETLVNVNNFKRESKITKESTGLNNEYIVVTILVAELAVYELPAIISHKNLKQTLEMLGSKIFVKLLTIEAVEVLWTPQVKGDILTEKDLLEKFPHLKPL